MENIEHNLEQGLNADIVPYLKDPSEMTGAEKKKARLFYRERLKALNAYPRSDWHRQFERILREEVRPYGNDIDIKIEEELGIDPPRVDYIILDDKKRLMRGKAIYRIFRWHNILEYKNPHDALNLRVISKITGYANLYIGLAEREDDRAREEVTISIFREKKNETLFNAMMKNGTLEKTDIPGIYLVKKLTDLPFQIVITSELQGEEYAAYRVLSDNAKDEDLAIVWENKKKAAESGDQETKESLEKLSEFVEIKNPGILRRVIDAIGGDGVVASVLMDVLKPEIDEKMADDRRTNLFNYVQNGTMTLDNGAKNAGMTTAEFTTSMKKAGFKVPQGA